MEAEYKPYPHRLAIRLFCRGCQLLIIPLIYWVALHWGPIQQELGIGLQGQAMDWAKFSLAFLKVSWAILTAFAVVLLPQWWLSTNSIREGLRRNPTQPWLARPDWARKHIVLNNRSGFRVLGLTLLVVLLVAWPFGIGQGSKVSYGIAIGATILWLLVFRMVWLGRKWNRAELKFADVPGIVGGPLSGAIILQETFPAETVFAVTLRCNKARVRTRREKGHRKKETYFETIWSETLPLSKTLKGPVPGTTAIPFSFAIPYSCVQTDLISNQPVYWDLSAGVQNGLPGMHATFPVPVFRTSESQLHYQPDNTLVDKYIERIDPEQVIARYHMREEKNADGAIQWTFSHWNQSIFFGLLLFGLICLGPMVWILLAVRPWSTALFVAVFPGFFVAICAYGIYDLVTWRCRLRFIPHARPENQDKRRLAALQSRPHYQILYESGVFGFRSKGTYPSSDDCQLGTHQIVHNTASERWDVILAGRGETKKVTVLSVLKSRHEAEAVVDYLAEKVSLAKRKGHTTEIVPSR